MSTSADNTHNVVCGNIPHNFTEVSNLGFMCEFKNAKGSNQPLIPDFMCNLLICISWYISNVC